MPLDTLSALDTGSPLFESEFADYCKTLLGINLYPYQLPEKAVLPAGTYAFVAYDAVKNLDGASGVASIRFQFDLFSMDYSDCVALSEVLRANLNGFQGLIGTHRVQSCWFENDFGGYDVNIDGSDRGSYHRTIDFSLMVEEVVSNLISPA